LFEAIAFLFGALVWLVSGLWYLVKIVRLMIARVLKLFRRSGSSNLSKSEGNLPVRVEDGEQKLGK